MLVYWAELEKDLYFKLQVLCPKLRWAVNSQAPFRKSIWIYLIWRLFAIDITLPLLWGLDWVLSWSQKIEEEKKKMQFFPCNPLILFQPQDKINCWYNFSLLVEMGSDENISLRMFYTQFSFLISYFIIGCNEFPKESCKLALNLNEQVLLIAHWAIKLGRCRVSTSSCTREVWVLGTGLLQSSSLFQAATGLLLLSRDLAFSTQPGRSHSSLLCVNPTVYLMLRCRKYPKTVSHHCNDSWLAIPSLK